MMATMALLVCLNPQTTAHVPQYQPVSAGIIKEYAPGLMEAVARHRRLTLPPGYDGFASRPDCVTIGSSFYVRANGRTVLVMQADCAQTRDYVRQVREALVAEVGYTVAVRLGFERNGKTRGVVWNVP